jgi:hypothetical protein
MIELKQNIYNHCLRVIDDKIVSLQKVLADLKDSGSNETKSTAGDKHETALAMLQIEQANVRAQLQEVLEQKATLLKISPSVVTASVVNGSLVRTDKGYFFISIPLGKIVIDGITIIILSAKSPLGNKLMGLQEAGVAEINNNRYVIEHIV